MVNAEKEGGRREGERSLGEKGEMGKHHKRILRKEKARENLKSEMLNKFEGLRTTVDQPKISIGNYMNCTKNSITYVHTV